ncbi:hypothetical protein CYV25_10305 [Carnobacterium maltaromaticum]|uniref:C40 family peptidase n=1 Tax=Carnobacterium maltaromaticum TaxID=2751 RepID=UPI000C767348|nr:C40 family peptidase [Carnobacterium maltaromaticum]PLS44004.1 hypothetical protein CYV27_10310 [Carnobacterium maltaromaticum]PLS51018.1 hypothetical protein CYV25_10305 [Carnobacterium maltaromaticum]
MNKRLATIAIIGSMTFSSVVLPAIATADTMDSKIEQQDNKINTLKANSSSTQADLEAIETSIATNETSAKELLAEIKAANNEMQQLDQEIGVLQTKIEQRNEQLQNQARSVQVNGDSANYVEFVINAESVTDIIGRIDVVSKLVTANRDLVKEQVRDQESVKTKKTETEKKVNQQNTLAGQLEATQAKLASQKFEKEAVVAQLASETATAEGEKAGFLAQKAEAEKQAALLATAKEESAKAVQVAAATKETATIATNTASNQDSAANSSSSADSSTPAPVNPTPTPNPDNGNNGGNGGNGGNVTPPANKPDPTPIPDPPATGGGTSWSNLQPIAESLIGIPYQWGGTTTSGFDCSGFTQYVFAKAGVSIPRVASAQYSASQKVSNPRAGDLVFFSQPGSGGVIDHVGIYVNSSTFIGSQSTPGVAYASYSGYWGAYIVGYGRY